MSQDTLSTGAATDTGLLRDRNEDRYFLDPAHGVFLVVDGVGGQAFHAGNHLKEVAPPEGFVGGFRFRNVNAEGMLERAEIGLVGNERDIETAVPDKSATLVLYCGGGFRSALAADNLQKMGYTNCISMDGGWRSWTEADFPTEKE